MRIGALLMRRSSSAFVALANLRYINALNNNNNKKIIIITLDAYTALQLCLDHGLLLFR